MIVKSKYKTGLLIFIITSSILFIFIGCSMFPSENDLRYHYFSILLALLVVVSSIALLISFFQLSPRIVLDDEFITAKKLFGSTVYDWDLATDVFLSSH